MPGSERSSSADPDFIESNKSRHKRPRKRRKRVHNPEQERKSITDRVTLIVASLFAVLRNYYAGDDDAFEELIEPVLEDCIQVRSAHLENLIDVDESGRRIRPLRSEEISTFIDDISKKDTPSPVEAIVLRKLKLERKLGLKGRDIRVDDVPLTCLPPSLDPPSADPEVLDALYSIQTTPFNHSFLSRLQGTKQYMPPGVIAVDWETRAPWMNLMTDIHDHYRLSHPEREHPVEEVAPITYSTLNVSQLPQVHDLLERSFWSGIDVSDSLDYQPEQVTVVAMYKKIVVGVAIMSSPRETYIMFLAVKAGWDKSQIGRTMLYHLITMNPHKDITLHVSVNNSAMLLYNQFGFKAEEFVAGFYSQYLDPQSRASTNAFKLRLRKL